MKVKVARTAGFCMGVRRAVNKALDAARDAEGPICSLGPIIHNPQVVAMLAESGLVAVKEIPESGAVVIRSHGVGPEVRRAIKEKGLTAVNATCQRVSKVHAIVAARHRAGYLVVVLGDAGHAEVEGIAGYAEGAAWVIQGPEQVAALPDADKVCLVAQTTQEREIFAAVAEAIQNRYPGLTGDALIIADTICDSTRNRQDEVRRLSKLVEAFVVVGGKESANTRRLAEVAREEGIPSFLAETEEDLPEAELKRFKTVGLTAGASTPNWMIRRVHDRLINIRERRTLTDLIVNAGRFLVMGNLFTAAGAFFLGAAAMFMLDLLFRPLIFWIDFLFVFALHTLIMLGDQKALALNVPTRARSMSVHRNAWAAAAIAALCLGSSVGLLLNLWYGGSLILLAAVSLLYPVRLFSRARASIRSLAEVPASKDIFMALGWAALIVVLPLFAIDDNPDLPSLALAFLLVFGVVFVRALLRDFRDIQADRLIGRDTLPIAIGATRTRVVIYLGLAALAALCVGADFLGWVNHPIGLFMIAPLLYQAVCVPLFTRRTLVQGFRAEAITDAVFFIAGVSGLAGYYFSLNN